ncbi:hypothetical protein E2C01_007031 [Portunus trituberculatus]|uniref:Uncharacterized protein n=1 Tax=Portunus trituberculatus TaxID=210409 RepID=A0A5B7CYC5_PORTR|nr:hypothetical protein [Portunus trituberculatus]
MLRVALNRFSQAAKRSSHLKHSPAAKGQPSRYAQRLMKRQLLVLEGRDLPDFQNPSCGTDWNAPTP